MVGDEKMIMFLILKRPTCRVLKNIYIDRKIFNFYLFMVGIAWSLETAFFGKRQPIRIVIVSQLVQLILR